MAIPTTKRNALTAWELPQLLTPMHQQKRPTMQNLKERPHYLPILTYVYRNRFAIAQQIQRRFSGVLKSDRTTRRHLAEMEALGWLGVAATRGTSPLWPKTYLCTPRGARKLRDTLAAKGKPGHIIRLDRRRSKGHSADHVLHEVLTTEFMLMVWESVQTDDRLELLRVERRSIPSQSSFTVALGGKLTRVEPDAWFVYRERGRGMICCFVEIDAGSMSKQQLKAKFYRYERWAQLERGREFLLDLYRRLGAKTPRPVFRILAIAARTPVAKIENHAKHILDAAASFPVVDRRLWVTTSQSLVLARTNILQAEYWQVGDR